jgi:hypothetical protein
LKTVFRNKNRNQFAKRALIFSPFLYVLYLSKKKSVYYPGIKTQ